MHSPFLRGSIFSQERILERTGEKIVDVPVQVAKEILQMIMDTSQEHMCDRTGEQHVAVRVPCIMKEIFAEIMDFPSSTLPGVWECRESMCPFRSGGRSVRIMDIPKVRIYERPGERIVGVLLPSFANNTTDAPDALRRYVQGLRIRPSWFWCSRGRQHVRWHGPVHRS